jgi:hypothetical protein
VLVGSVLIDAWAMALCCGLAPAPFGTGWCRIYIEFRLCREPRPPIAGPRPVLQPPNCRRGAAVGSGCCEGHVVCAYPTSPCKPHGTCGAAAWHVWRAAGRLWRAAVSVPLAGRGAMMLCSDNPLRILPARTIYLAWTPNHMQPCSLSRRHRPSHPAFASRAHPAHRTRQPPVVVYYWQHRAAMPGSAPSPPSIC